VPGSDGRNAGSPWRGTREATYFGPHTLGELAPFEAQFGGEGAIVEIEQLVGAREPSDGLAELRGPELSYGGMRGGRQPPKVVHTSTAEQPHPGHRSGLPTAAKQRRG